MKLMTEELKKKFKKVGSQEHVKDPIVIAHFFNPVGRGDWFATEYDEEQNIIFGYASLFNDYNNEWGYTSLDELAETKLPFGLSIERDRYWKPKTISAVKEERSIV